MSRYPLFKVHIDHLHAMDRIGEVLQSGFINEGVQVTRLTLELQHKMKARNLILLNSCTSAITLALKLSGVGEDHDDAVVSTPMTCVASNTPIVTSGASIRWADVDPSHGMVTPETVDKALSITTKAVIVVAWAGNVPDLRGIWDLCKKFNTKLILDAAHAFGATYEGKPIHEWADYTCYSFQAIKHFTTGDGGALVCNDNNDYKRSKAMKWFGLDRDKAKDEKGDWKGQQWDVDIEEAGYKFNMNNVAAAIGLSQLQHIDGIISAHRKNADLYDELFLDMYKNDGYSMALPNVRFKDSVSSHWVYAMQLKDDCRLSRDELLNKLNAQGIMAGVVHVPNDDYTCFQKFKTELPGVRAFAKRQFSLPCGWWLNADDIKYIATQVKELTE